MSQKEFDQKDREAINLANKTVPEGTTNRADQAPEIQDGTEKRKKKIYTALVVLECLAIAASLMVALFVPSTVVWGVNIGVLLCGMRAAGAVDRHIRGD